LPQVWKPTAPGKLFTKAKDWSLSLNNEQFELIIQGRKLAGNAALLENLGVTTGAFWATLKVTGANGQVLALDGIPNADAHKLKETLTAMIGVIRHREEVDELIRDFGRSVQPVIDWALTVRQACISQLRSRGWLTFEFKERFSDSKPRGLSKLLAVPEVERHLTRQSQEVQEAVAMWKRPFQEVADGINKRHMAKELVESKEFFDKVEKSPLTSEQTEAVVCFDSRVLLVA
jgi:DNA helicase-4